MKKHKQLISIILIATLLFGIFSVNIYASEDNIVYSKVLHHHFHKLYGNIPSNYHNNCGYVAMSMVLSFYDCYWSDEFVAENYEGVKPNINENNLYPNFSVTLKDEELSDVEKTDETDYRTFIEKNKNNYLHSHLLSLGINKGLHPTNDEKEGFEITIIEMAEILDDYFDEVFGAGDYYSADGTYDETLPITIHIVSARNNGGQTQNVINSIKEQINNGNPVIYRGDKIKRPSGGATRSSGSSGDDYIGHFMVAYYIEDSEDIVFHTSNSSDSYVSFSDTEYNLNIEALWMEINENVFEHDCSDNYRWAPTNSNVCSCIAYKDMHPAHVHEDSGIYISSNATRHIYGCVWGDIGEASHNHNSNSVVSNSLHKSICSCGYKYTEMHFFKQTTPRYSVCVYCGYTRDEWGPGQSVIMGTEDEEESE